MMQTLTRSGTPVFVMATTESLPPEPLKIQDASRLMDLIPSDTHLIDRLMHLCVKGFFHLGGHSLIVLPIQISAEAEDLNHEYLHCVSGHDAGYLRRSGYHALKNHDGLGDLIVFPQAPVILDAQELGHLYRDVLATLEKFLPKFLLMDTPSYSSPEKAIELSKNLSGCGGAVFYPWISVHEVGFLPVSILAAAFLQTLDNKFGIAEPLANRTLPGNFEPLTDLALNDVRRLTSSRINCLRRMPDGSLAFWGTYTLSRSADHLNFIHIVRALRALQDAIERTCEPYLMEARTDTTCKKLEDAVSSLLQEAEELGILATHITSGAKNYHVECSIESNRAQGQDPVLSLHAEVAIESPDRRIGMSLNL